LRIANTAQTRAIGGIAETEKERRNIFLRIGYFGTNRAMDIRSGGKDGHP